MRRSSLTLLLALVALSLLALLQPAAAIQFSLRHGEETCLSEDVSTGQMLIGDFVIDPSDGRVAVAVSDAGGIEIYRKSVSSEGRFAHTASRDGEYRMCFANVEGLSQKSVQLSLSSGGRDYKELAKKSNLKPLELELKRLEDTVQLVHQEMKVLKEREMLMREVNDSTSRRVLWFSVMSIVVLVGLSVGQIVYLKKYFKGKKLI